MTVSDDGLDLGIEYAAVVGILTRVRRLELAMVIEPTVVSAAVKAVEFEHALDSYSKPQCQFRNVLSDFKPCRIRNYLVVDKTPGLFFRATFSAAISSTTSFKRLISRRCS